MKKKINIQKKIDLKPFVIVSFFIFLVIQVIYTIQVAAYGGKLSKLETEYEQLSEKNESLSADVVKNSSLSLLYEQANSEGYIKPTSVVYIAGTDFVAQAR